MRWGIICTLFVLACSPVQAADNPVDGVLGHADHLLSGSSLNRAAQAGRDAAVRVMSEKGTGSGSYVTYKGQHLIITAAHVVEDVEIIVIEERDKTLVGATVVYFDNPLDIAVLRLSAPLTTRKPVKFATRSGAHGIGEHVSYTGFPNNDDLLSLEGNIAGYTNVEGHAAYIMQSYTWFGASGSCVYDDRGNLVGVVRAFEASIDPSHMPLNNAVVVMSITDFDIERLEKGIIHEVQRQNLQVWMSAWETEDAVLYPPKVNPGPNIITP